jgi:Raf kinase inhibitor-like YbhB/YbcL family protein
VLRRLALALLVTAVACGSNGEPTKSASTTASTARSQPAGVIQLTSPAFTDGGDIPREFTCDGANQSPPLKWKHVGSGTASFALRMQDVDTSQKFVHWLAYNIPPDKRELAAGEAPPGATQATNSFGKPGYGGPCPPAGQRHRYVFTLLALSTALTASEQVSPAELWSTLERSAVTAKGELTAGYKRAG